MSNATVADVLAEPDPPEIVQVPERTRPPEFTTDKAIAKYLNLRRKLEAKQKDQALELAPIKAAMGVLENWLTSDLHASNVNSMRCDAGTAYFDKRTTATVENWDAFIAFVQESGIWELLERRVSKTAAENLLEETKVPVPGVKHSREIILKVRRS